METGYINSQISGVWNGSKLNFLTFSPFIFPASILARGLKILIWIAWSTATMWENGNCFAKLSLSHFLDGYRESSLLQFFFSSPLLQSYIYQGTLNIDPVLWRTQLIVCAENVKSWFKSWVFPFTFQAYIQPHTLNCMCVSLFKFHIWILEQF